MRAVKSFVALAFVLGACSAHVAPEPVVYERRPVYVQPSPVVVGPQRVVVEKRVVTPPTRKVVIKEKHDRGRHRGHHKR